MIKTQHSMARAKLEVRTRASARSWMMSCLKQNQGSRRWSDYVKPEQRNDRFTNLKKSFIYFLSQRSKEKVVDLRAGTYSLIN